MHATSASGSAYWISGWPQLVAEWHPTRNAGLDPSEVSRGSGRKIWWKCPRGPDHEWQTSANNRTWGGTGCPYCAGRQVSVTNSLAALRPDLASQWHPARNGDLEPSRVVAGSTRPAWWRCAVVGRHEWRVSPHDRLNLGGECPFCLGLRVSADNSLAITCPRVAAEWHPTKNQPLTADDVVGGSSRRVWWRCRQDEGHEWRASVSNRVRRMSRCPFCQGRKASRKHSLAAAFPQIAAEWHPRRNGGLTPSDVTPYAHRRVWWLCARGHEWSTRVNARTRRSRPCPGCAGKALPVGGPRLARVHERTRATAAGDLREEHRRIEQIFTLMSAGPLRPGDLSGMVADVRAHLEAEATVLYPLLERTLARPLAILHENRSRLERALSRISSLAGDVAALPGAWRELRAAFDAHARFEESVALPALESLLNPPSLERLGDEMRAVRQAAVAPR